MANASSYISSPDTLDIPNITFPELLGRLAAAKPDKAAYIFIDDQENAHSLTYRELYEKASKFARVLVNFGIMKGDKVALSGGNVPEWLIANFGIQMAGVFHLLKRGRRYNRTIPKYPNRKNAYF